MQFRRSLLHTLLVISCGLCSAVVARDGTASLEDGVFTEEQAKRGERVYRQACASCHANDMRGGPAARGLAGALFEFQWRNRTLAELFGVLRSRMPPGAPGTLDEQAYVDVLAAILQRNGFPAGEVELVADEQSMDDMLFQWRRAN